MYTSIEMKLENKIIRTTAMIDTGNLLKEPITNTPVVVLEHTLLYEILPKSLYINRHCNFDNRNNNNTIFKIYDK